MADVLEKLSRALPDLPKKLGVAARYALDHPDRIALESMRASAAACGVASPTMVRLARALGFESYELLRQEFKQRLVASGFGGRARAMRSSAARDGLPPLSQQIAAAAGRNIAEAAAVLDPEAVDRFARRVRDARRVYVTGVGSMHWIASLTAAIGSVAIDTLRADLSGNATAIEMLATIGPEDALLALAIAPYARRTVDAARFARSRGASVFAITDRRSAPVAAHADAAFIAPADSPHFYPSVAAVTVVAEILLAAAVAEIRSVEPIERLDALRRSSGAFCD